MTKFIEVTCKKTGVPTLIGIDSIKNVGGWEHAEIQIGENLLVVAEESYKEVVQIIKRVEIGMVTNTNGWVH